MNTPKSRTAEDFFGCDFRLEERNRDRSIDRFIPKKIEKRLFSLNPKAERGVLTEKVLEKPQQNSTEDFNKKLLEQHKKDCFEDILESNLLLSKQKSNYSRTEMKETVERKLFCYSTNKKRKNALHDEESILTFQEKAYEKQSLRKIESTPCKVLDAPGMEDDFYKQVLEWTSTNLLLVGLRQSIYSWAPDTNNTEVVFSSEAKEDRVTALKANREGSHLLVGTSSGVLHLVSFREKDSVELSRGFGRISCLDLFEEIAMVGCRDRGLVMIDLATKKETDMFGVLELPQNEVCGLKFSHNGKYLAAGCNDNRFFVFDMVNMKLVLNTMEHKAAVRAVGWSHKNANLVASGGGRKDKCINIWNVTTGKLEKKIETESQVCGIIFSKTTDEFISTHGFSNNSIQVWETKDYSKIAELVGHTERVLYQAMNPEACTLVTSAADETLRFWDVFPKPEKQVVDKSIFQSFLNLR